MNEMSEKGEWVVENPEIEKFIRDGNTTFTMPDPDFYKETNGKLLYQNIFNMLNGSKMNAYQEIKAWRKYGKQMLGYMRTMTDGMKAFSKETARYKNATNDRQGKRWTDAEDEMLVELMCDDEHNLLEISRTLGRSVAAISTRCSYLVGVERKYQNISGKFQGKLNGLVVDGTIDGVLLKGE